MRSFKDMNLFEYVDSDEIICGIDEAGRGCIAGSLFICGVKCSIADIAHIAHINDSKKINRKTRDSIFIEIQNRNIKYCVIKFNACDIDNNGISNCMNKGLSMIMNKIDSKRYLFDGNTSFKVNGIDCIVKGDNKIPQISLASIIAKSLKDKESDELHIKYPNYQLNNHKGYATKTHKKLIKLYGLSSIHRKSFKMNLEAN